jgi:hypothetical protein
MTAWLGTAVSLPRGRVSERAGQIARAERLTMMRESMKHSVLFIFVALTLCVSACEQDADDSDWQRVGTSSYSVSDHFSRFPQCHHESSAYTACTDANAASCLAYAQTFANTVGAHLAEVERHLADSCLGDTDRMGCSAYAAAFPQGQHSPQVEDHIWTQCESGLAGACESYRRVFPAGRHRSAAQARSGDKADEHPAKESRDTRASPTPFNPPYTDCAAWSKVLAECASHRGYDPSSQRDRVLVQTCARLIQSGCWSIQK